MKHYTVEYLENGIHEEPKEQFIVANSKADAYSKFLKHFGYVYAAWVARVTHNNGNIQEFNTFAGKPY